jgi:hypothetical protein
MEPLEIRFTFDAEDLVAFHEHHLISSDYIKRRRRKAMATGALVAMLYLAFLLWGSGDKVQVYTILALFAAISFSMPYLYKYRTLRAARKLAASEEISRSFGPQRIEFHEEHIINEMPKMESKLPWDGISRYDQNDDYFFLYTSNNTAIVIPKKKIDGDVKQLDALLSQKVS